MSRSRRAGLILALLALLAPAACGKYGPPVRSSQAPAAAPAAPAETEPDTEEDGS